MSSQSVQFHATLEELTSLLSSWMAQHAFYMVAEEFPPARARSISAEEVPRALELPAVSRLVFTEALPVLPQGGVGHARDLNEGALSLNIGRLGPRGMEECMLSTMTSTPTWKKMFASLKKITSAGAIGVHDETGATAKYAAHRFTPGAKSLQDAGVPMRPFAQSAVRFEFQD